jgi:hypothetical protein
MKLIVLSLISISCIFLNSVQIDYISIDEVLIDGHQIMGENERYLREAFGEPDSVIIEFDWLVDEEPLFNYFYFSNKFKIKLDKVIGFELNDFQFNLNNYKVGDIANILKKEFDKSYIASYSPSGFEDLRILKVGVESDGVKTDSYIRFWVGYTHEIVRMDFWEEL